MEMRFALPTLIPRSSATIVIALPDAISKVLPDSIGGPFRQSSNYPKSELDANVLFPAISGNRAADAPAIPEVRCGCAPLSLDRSRRPALPVGRRDYPARA